HRQNKHDSAGGALGCRRGSHSPAGRFPTSETAEMTGQRPVAIMFGKSRWRYRGLSSIRAPLGRFGVRTTLTAGRAPNRGSRRGNLVSTRNDKEIANWGGMERAS